MSELVLDYRANPGAMGAGVGAVYLNASGQLCVVLNDGVEHVFTNVQEANAFLAKNTFNDGTTAGLTIANVAAPTKKFSFDASGVTAGQNRVLKAPDADVILAGSAAALTSGRMPRVTTGGLLLDDANSPTCDASGNVSIKGALTISAAAINDIGTPGGRGFGVGICPTPPAGMHGLVGYTDPASDDWGNYQYADGSIMCWIPGFYYIWGTGANGFAINVVDIKPLSAYANEAAANAAGYALHRMFYDNGAAQLGVFVDKYIASNNAGTASSIRNGNPLSSNAAHNPFSGLTGTPADFYYGAIAAAKTRGANFFCNSRFIFAGLAMLAYAHAQASSGTTYCAWYNATYNTPKGCNNNALGDDRDGSILYLSDGYSNAAKTGSANLFSRTTHNGQNSGVADLNGCMWEITPGLTTDAGGAGYYVLKTSAQMKSVTGGNAGATDLWGATGIAALYDSLGATYEAAAASSTAKLYGAATQVLSAATSGNAWAWAGAGGPLTAGVGGTNAFGSDGFWDYRPADMCPVSGGYWAGSSYAGVWALGLSTGRGASYDSVGFRAALYL